MADGADYPISYVLQVEGDETVKSKLQGTADSISDVGTKTDEAAQKTSNYTSVLKDSALGLSAATSSAIGLYFQYDNLEKVQTRVDKAERTLTAAKSSLITAQEAVNKLNQKGVTSGAAYEKAQLDLKAAQDGVSIATDRLSQSQGDLSESQLHFALGVVPTVISTISTMKTVMGGLKAAKLLNVAATAADSEATIASTVTKGALTTATVGQTVATEEATMATRLLNLAMGPVGIAILGVSTFMALFATNAFGIRDAINAAGKAIGDAVPILRPLLDGLSSLANTIFPDASHSATTSSSDMQKAFADATSAASTNFGSMSDNIGISKDSITANLTALQTNTTTAMAGIDDDTSKAKTGVSSSLDSISGKFSATASDVESAAARMREAIASLGGNTAVSSATPAQQQAVLKENMLTPQQVQAYGDVIRQYQAYKSQVFGPGVTMVSGQQADTLTALLDRAQEAERLLALDQEARRQYSDIAAQQNVNVTVTVDQNGELQAKLSGVGKNGLYLNHIN